MSAHASGMALSIRKAEESETFDLAGANVDTIKHTIEAAFSEPLPLREMIRITFVTGAGKQARQKYDENAARVVTSTLRELGFEEDRAASCVEECAGTFKQQHDTGKNLKTVVVFPKIQAPQNGDDQGGRQETLVPPDCPAGQIARASATVFQNMLKAKCPSWSQKKGCAAALEHLKSMVDELDCKLMQGQPLTDAEQDFYDHTTGLDEKLSLCKEAIHEQVESGNVTKFEKDILLQHNAERLESLKEEMSAAKGPKLEKLMATKTKIIQRKEMLEEIEPVSPHKLKYAVEISKLWKEVVPMLQLEEKCKGRLLSVKETQTMARKDEIMQEIEEYENASRGWFEDEDAFEARVKAIRATYTAKLKTKPPKFSGSYAAAVANATTTSTGMRKAAPLPSLAAKGPRTTSFPLSSSAGSSPAAVATSPTNTWVTPGQDNKKNAWNNSATKKKKKNKGTGVFAAMMANDDSDSDAEAENDDVNESDEEQDETTIHSNKGAAAATTDSPDENETGASGKKKKGKKKKTKGGKKKSEADMSEDELLNSTAAANRALEKQKEDVQEKLHPAIAFVKNYLIPFILWFIAFIVSLFFGKPKKKQKKS